MSGTEWIATATARLLALLLLAAALLLSLPGIRAVRADEPDMTPVGPGDFARLVGPDDAPPAAPAESCGEVDTHPAVAEHAPRPVALPAPAMQPGEPGVEVRPGVVVLNNRGYNYAPTQGPDPAQWLDLGHQGSPSAD